MVFELLVYALMSLQLGLQISVYALLSLHLYLQICLLLPILALLVQAHVVYKVYAFNVQFRHLEDVWHQDFFDYVLC